MTFSPASTTRTCTRRDRVKPRIDARRSIVRADLHDRTVGITAPSEVTPAVALLHRYGSVR